MEFHLESYKKHSNSYHKVQAEEIEFYRNWFESQTVDVWRHLRMLEVLNPFLEEYKESRWLTIGDGRFGTAATYITKNGCLALPTDIDTRLLELAKENELISDYREENAEKLSFSDESFDFAYCKESFHHFPRPYLAVYEMLRCTKHAIIFTEPRDWIPSPIPLRILQVIKKKIKQALGLSVSHTDEGNYEEVGNYVYTISKREFEKIAMGLNMPMIAYKKFHDVYLKGVENEKLGKYSTLYRKISRKLLMNHLKSKIGLSGENRISIVIFKTIPSEALKVNLRSLGYQVIALPRNPYC